jgi:Asparagine synthase
LYVDRVALARDDAERSSGRTLLAGWIDRPAASGAGALSGLQSALDRRGPAAVRELRGDFVLAHVSSDRRTLALYRGLTAMVPLFWRTTGGLIRWSTHPTDLLDGAAPQLSDVALDLLPMIIAERGFPHDRSWFTQVHRLPAGACLTLRAGGAPVVDRFDAFAPSREQPRSVREAAEGLRTRIERACRRPVSANDEALLLLSGGIDSAAVAYELGRTCSTTAMHFTLNGFPGFDGDRRAASSIAGACRLAFLPYDMGGHVRSGGDYADEGIDGNLPQTHVPLRGIAGCAQEARARGARFVFSGILADQVMARLAARPDRRRRMVEPQPAGHRGADLADAAAHGADLVRRPGLARRPRLHALPARPAQGRTHARAP